MKFWKFIIDDLFKAPKNQLNSDIEENPDSSDKQNNSQNQNDSNSNSDHQNSDNQGQKQDNQSVQNNQQNQNPSQDTNDSDNKANNDAQQSQENDEESQSQKSRSNQGQNPDSSDKQNNFQNQNDSNSNSDHQNSDDQGQKQDNQSVQNNQQNQGTNNSDNKANNDAQQNQENDQEFQSQKNQQNSTDKDTNILNKKQKELLNTLKNRLQKLSENQVEYNQQTKSEKTDTENELPLNPNNEFLKRLGELPSFEDRNRGPGYAIDTESTTDIKEIIIKNLITKFLNQRFCKSDTDLNQRSNSLEKSDGFYKWEVKDVIVHLKTKQITKALRDKYGYKYAEGKFETIPLSFYFDLSLSMSEYTNMLATIAIELLKKNVKVLIGYNEYVNVQIDSIKESITVKELAEILSSAGYYRYSSKKFKEDNRVEFKYVNKNIDRFLIEKHAEKCVVFSDFDPIKEVTNLSKHSKLYWFCFEEENDENKERLNEFEGFIYGVQTIDDIEKGLLKVNEKRFETLVHFDNQFKIKRK